MLKDNSKWEMNEILNFKTKQKSNNYNIKSNKQVDFMTQFNIM